MNLNYNRSFARNSVVVITVISVLALGILSSPMSGKANAQSSQIEVDIVPGASTGKTTDAYDPYPVEINVGDTVIWTNDDNTLHTATSGNSSDGPTGMFGGTGASPNYLGPGTTQEFTFTEEGEFEYYCTLHPAMIGIVIVGDGNSGIVSRDFQLSQEGTAKTKGETYDLSFNIEGEYLYYLDSGTLNIDDELEGTLTIDDTDFVLTDIDMRVSKNMKKINISAKIDEPTLKILGISGTLTSTLNFSPSINFAEAEDDESNNKNNALKVTFKGLKSSFTLSDKEPDGSITFS